MSNLIMLRLEGTGPTFQLYGKKGLASLVPIKDLAKGRLPRDPITGMSSDPRDAMAALGGVDAAGKESHTSQSRA